ncbi:MAG: hypothetical protein ACI4PL_05990 [Faecousia sp.]
MEAKMIEEIGKADGYEVEELLKALIQRYAVLYPDWELGVISLKKTMDRNEQLDGMIRILQGLKE